MHAGEVQLIIHYINANGAAIEEMAGMDVLCTDKTGTLTLYKLTVDKNLIEIFAKGVDADMVVFMAARASIVENQDAIDVAILGMLVDPKEGIEMLSLGSFKTGVILLAGLFVCDIFWVFFTPIMLSVAKSFDAPMNLLFPSRIAAHSFSMLALGDIVIPTGSIVHCTRGYYQ